MTDTTPALPPTTELSAKERQRGEALRKMPPRLAQSCENIRLAIASRGDQSADEQQPKLPISSEPPQPLPFFREAFAIPNAILRAALFPARDDQRQLFLWVGDNYFCGSIRRADGVVWRSIAGTSMGSIETNMARWSPTRRSAC
jgi:hypothetical protein